MKRLFCLLFALAILFSLSACKGNWEEINLKDPISIPKNGIIEKNIIIQIKDENAIGIFTGNADDYKYEWTIFGSDINQPKEINLAVQITKTTDGDMQITLNQEENFGFSALLSIYLNERWEAQSATAFANDTTVASVSLTGSKNTIANITLDGSVSNLIIRPDPIIEEETTAPVTEPTVSEETTVETTTPTTSKDDYLSKPSQTNDAVYSNGKDKYFTDAVPEGKPKPVEPEDQNINKVKSYSCTFSIECSTILNNLSMLDPDKLEIVPTNGVILAKTKVTFYEGESVYDVLQRLCKEKGIHMEASWTPIYNSAYVEGIHNLYEFDCGALSGWMYQVNGWYPTYGCSRYQLKDGDVVQWRYTCDLGNDVGGSYAVGG